MAPLCFSGCLELLRPQRRTRLEPCAEKADTTLRSAGSSEKSPRLSQSSTRCPTGSTRASQHASSSSPERAICAHAWSIAQMSQAEFSHRYVLKSPVMRSGHKGIDVLFSRRTSDDQIVVVKAYNKRTAFADSTEELKWRDTMEAQLSLPKSNLICDLMEVVETATHFYAVMERVDGKDLWAWKLRAGACFKPDVVREIVKQILQGVSVLHRSGRVHKDLKRENIMLTMDRRRRDDVLGLSVKLIDFDTAEAWRPGAPPAAEVVGTQGYIAPEAYLGHSSPASDMFSVGVILYKLLTDQFPFPQVHEIKLDDPLVGSACTRRLHECLAGAHVDFSLSRLAAFPAAAALCRSLLDSSPEMRPSAEAALEHAWFSQSI